MALKETTVLRLLEAHGKEGKEWDIVVIEPGVSKNGRHYSPAVLRTSVPLFEGAHVFAYEFADGTHDHLPENQKAGAKGGPAKNLVGWLEAVRYGTYPGGEGILAKLHLTENAAWLRKLMASAFGMGKKDLLGFSIDANGHAEDRIIEGKRVSDVTAIESVDSVDVVTYPAAKGGFLRLVASQGKNMTYKEILNAIREGQPHMVEGFETTDLEESAAQDLLPKIIEACREKALTELGALDRSSEKFAEVAGGVQALQNILALLNDGNVEEAMALISELLAGLTAPAPAPAATPPAPPAPAPAQESNVDDKIKLAEMEVKLAAMETKTLLAEALAGSKLPDVSQVRIRDQFEGRAVTKEQITESIQKEKDYIANFDTSGKVTGTSGPKHEHDVRVTLEEKDKIQLAMDGMLSGKPVYDKDKNRVHAFTGLHESYRVITGFAGSQEETGARILDGVAFCLPGKPGREKMFAKHHRNLRESAQASRLTEAIDTSTWGEVFGDSIRRALIREYMSTSTPDWRRAVSSIVPAQDFRENKRIRVGGYGDLPIVAQNATYQEQVTPPGDEEATYSVAKRGRLEVVSLEAVTNDDLGAIRAIPQRLGRAAARTLSKFVLKTLISDNANTTYDATNAVASGHSNRQSAALSATTLQNAIKQMREQTELSSDEKLGLDPRILVVPTALEFLGWELTESRVKITSNETATIPNVIADRFKIELLVNLWQDADDDGSGTADKNWFLLTDPAGNPTIEMGFLGGREEPELFVQDQPNVGSTFNADKVSWKIRHIYSGTVLDHRGFAGSLVA